MKRRFSPDNAFGLSLAERYAAAFHAARLNASAGLAAHYHEQLTCFPGAVSAAQIEAGTSDETRLAAILRHTALMTETPDEGTPKARGARPPRMPTRDVVVLSQLVAYVNFQTRLLAGLLLLGDN